MITLFRKKSLITLFLLLGSLFMAEVIYAGTTTSSTQTINITVQNPGTLPLSDAIVPVSMATQSLVDNGKISSNALNAHLHEGSSDVPHMPGSLKIDLVKSINRSVATDTTDANSSTTDDMELPYLINEEYLFALHNPAGVLHLQLSTATDHQFVVTWSYCDTSNSTTCLTWASFSNVVDSTKDSSGYGFRVAGARNISWDIPAAGAWGKENHTSVPAYWVKAKVTSVNAAGTIAPLGEQSSYETGQWWLHIPSITAGQTRPYGLFMGGSTDLQTYHHYFPGFEGVVTADAAGLEPGGSWRFEIQQNLKVDTNEAGKIIGKTGAFDLNYQSASSIGGNNQITMGVTGSASNTFYSIFKHSEEDGASYYSGTSEESHSKTFYNGSSNYITSHREDASDVLSNSDSSITSHKIGQAYDKTTDTTPAIGAKINDPS